MQFDLGPKLTMPQPKKGGMFANADWGSAIAAALGGFSAGMGSPAGMMALQALNQNRMMKQRAEQEAQRYQQQRQDGLTDYRAKKEIDAQFSSGPNNDTVADYNFILQTLGEGAATDFLKSKTNPIVMTPYGPMPYSAVAAPTRPVGKLTPIDGGPTQPASGGFPQPF